MYIIKQYRVIKYLKGKLRVPDTCRTSLDSVAHLSKFIKQIQKSANFKKGDFNSLFASLHDRMECERDQQPAGRKKRNFLKSPAHGTTTCVT